MCTDVLLPRDPGCPSRPVNCKLFKLMAESVGELQAALDVLSAFCDIFDFTVNMDKTE